MKRKGLFGFLAVFFILSHGSIVGASEAEMMAMIQNLQKQMAQMQGTIEAQNARLAMLEGHAGSVQIAGPGQGSGADQMGGSAMSEAEFKDRLNKSLPANKWLEGLVFKGDTRLRYEGANYTSGSQSETPDRNSFRFRLRFGFEKTFSPELKTGFELASGEASATNGNNVSPVSNNQSMDNDFNFKSIWIEKIFVTYLPEWAKVGPIAGFEITGGKVQNPFEKGSTDMIWDRDVKPEGIYEKADLCVFKSEKVDFKAYALAGQFILDDDQSTGGRDAQLFAYQIGLNPSFDLGITEKPVEVLSALSFYNYADYAKHSNFIIYGQSLAKGNPTLPWNSTRLDAQGFNVFESYTEVTVSPKGIPIRPFFDWARNMTDRPSMIMNGSDAWSLGLGIGKVNKKGDLEASYAYKWMGANSIVGAFTDSDFGRGTAGQRGSVIKFGCGLTNNMTLNAAGYFTNNLNAGTYGILDEEARKLVIDLNLKF